MKRVIAGLAWAVLLAGLFSGTGFAQEKKNFVFAGTSYLLPTTEARFQLQEEGTVLEVEKALGFGVGYRRMVRPKLGVGIEALYFNTNEAASRLGQRGESEEYAMIPILVGVTWHTGGDFDIFAGPALAYVLYGDRDGDFAPAVAVGLNVALGRRGWGLLVGAKYIHTEVRDDALDPRIGEGLGLEDPTAPGRELSVNVNPFVFSAAASFRF